MEWSELLKWVGVVLLGGGGGGLITTLIAQRTSLLSKRMETEPAILVQITAQLSECRRNEKRQGREINQLRGSLQTTWMAIEMMAQKFPEAMADVAPAIKRMKERQAEFLREQADEDSGEEETVVP